MLIDIACVMVCCAHHSIRLYIDALKKHIIFIFVCRFKKNFFTQQEQQQQQDQQISVDTFDDYQK